jgi:hypothetical protein
MMTVEFENDFMTSLTKRAEAPVVMMSRSKNFQKSNRWLLFWTLPG